MSLGFMSRFGNRRAVAAKRRLPGRTCPEAMGVISLALHGTGPHKSIKSQCSEPWACQWPTGKIYRSRMTFVLKAAAAAKFFAVCDNEPEKRMDGVILLRQCCEYVRRVFSETSRKSPHEIHKSRKRRSGLLSEPLSGCKLNGVKSSKPFQTGQTRSASHSSDPTPS